MAFTQLGFQTKISKFSIVVDLFEKENKNCSKTIPNQLKACRGQIDKSEVKLVRRYLNVPPCKIIAS